MDIGLNFNPAVRTFSPGTRTSVARKECDVVAGRQAQDRVNISREARTAMSQITEEPSAALRVRNSQLSSRSLKVSGMGTSVQSLRITPDSIRKILRLTTPRATYATSTLTQALHISVMI